jgi:hypothetical protein
MLEGEQGSGNRTVQQTPQQVKMGGPVGPGLPQRPPLGSSHIAKGKEKLDNAAQNMSVDPRPLNTAVRRRHSSTHKKMVEVTEMQEKQLVSNMQKLSDMEERKVAAASDITDKQLQYFRIRDSEIAITQRGLVHAVTGLSDAIVQAYVQRSGGGHRQQKPQRDASGHDIAAGARPPAAWSAPTVGEGGEATVRAPPLRTATDRGNWQGGSNADFDMRSPNTEDEGKEDSNGLVNINGAELA